MEKVLINESLSPLPNGNLLRCQSWQSGRSVQISLLFGLSLFKWWGVCDPKKDGFKKLFGNLYYKKGAKR